jgi:hypothetical protein
MKDMADYSLMVACLLLCASYFYLSFFLFSPPAFVVHVMYTLVLVLVLALGILFIFSVCCPCSWCVVLLLVV